MKTSEPILEIWYMRSWGTFHILTGIIFATIFILGSIVLNDFSFLLYVLFSAGLIWMGYQRLSKPYIVIYEKQIIVRGMFGETAHTYSWQNKNEITTSNNRVYLNNVKLKFNSWFTNKHQYGKLMRLLSDKPEEENELHD